MLKHVHQQLGILQQRAVDEAAIAQVALLASKAGQVACPKGTRSN